MDDIDSKLVNIESAPLKMKTLRIVFLFLCMFLTGSNLIFGEEPPPFWPGETLVYSLSWGEIEAGKVTLEVLPMKKIKGQNLYHFAMTVKSKGVVDRFYKIRDSYNAYSDKDMTGSFLYTRNHNGKKKKDVKVTFDIKNNTAQYSTGKNSQAPIDILPNTFDPLSAFFYIRFMLSHKASTIEPAITDGKKMILGKVVIIGRETIQLSGVSYKTILVEPVAEVLDDDRDDSKHPKVQIWLSADYRKIPLKIKSKAAIGSIIAELVSAKGLVEDNKS